MPTKLKYQTVTPLLKEVIIQEMPKKETSN